MTLLHNMGFHRASATFWHADREHLLLRTVGSVPFGRTGICSNVKTSLSRTCYVYRPWVSNIPRYFYFTYMYLYVYHDKSSVLLRQTWHLQGAVSFRKSLKRCKTPLHFLLVFAVSPALAKLMNLDPCSSRLVSSLPFPSSKQGYTKLIYTSICISRLERFSETMEVCQGLRSYNAFT